MSANGSSMLYPDVHAEYPFAVRARGSYIYDAEGRAYLDGCSSAIVVNVGHGNLAVLGAMKQQLSRLTFCYRSQFTNEPAEELARTLVRLAPGDLSHVQYTNSGSEAVEGAIRLALQYWQEVGEPAKRLIVSRDVSYHGATLGGLAVSGHDARRRHLLPILPEMPRAAAAHCHRCPFGLSQAGCSLECATDLERTIARVGAENIAAFIFEPVVGAAGGAVPAPPGYMRRVAEICARHQILLIADEVITGLGRTGSWFGSEAEGIAPDLLTLGKGMSAGYIPVGAVLASTAIWQAIRAGSGAAVVGHTYSGYPLAAATALAVIKYIDQRGLVDRALTLGTELAAGLREMLAERGIAADVRGRGLLIGVDFAPPAADPSPSLDSLITAKMVVTAAFRHGLILYPAGVEPTPRAVVVAPPLTITRQEISRLLAAFGAALDELAPRSSADEVVPRSLVRLTGEAR